MARWSPLPAAALISAVLALGLFLIAGGSGDHPGRSTQQTALTPKQVERLKSSPLAFEPTTTGYRTRGPGYDLWVGARGTRLAADGKVIQTELVGARRATGRAGNKLPFVVNRFQGARKMWRGGIPTYRDVTYEGVYRGVDVRYYGRNGRLEYDFIVGPQADPASIAMRIENARSIQVAPNGDLLIDRLRQHAPITYQSIDGSRVPVASRFVLDGNTVRFKIGRYDPTHPLVIDPSLVFGDYIGGSGVDNTSRLAIDAAGNIYLTGSTLGTIAAPTTHGSTNGSYDAYVLKLRPSGDREWLTYIGGSTKDLGTDIAVDGSNRPYVIGTTEGGINPTSGGAFIGGKTDAFVAALNADGTVRWSDMFGSALADTAGQVVVTQRGDVYFTTERETLDGNGLPIAPMAGFLAIYDSSGNYNATTSLNFDWPDADDNKGTVDPSDDIIGSDDDTLDGVGLVPGCNSDDCDVLLTGHMKMLKPSGNGVDKVRGVWIGRYDPQGVNGWGPYPFTFPTVDGTNLVYPGGEWPAALAISPDGNAGLIGTKSVGSANWVFAARFDKDYDSVHNKPIIDSPNLIWNVPPVNGNTEGDDVAFDAQGNMYMVGSSVATNGSDIDPVQPEPGGAFDAFVLKYFPDGPVNDGPPDEVHPRGRIVWSTPLGGVENEVATGVVVDASGGTYVSGAGASNFIAHPAIRPFSELAQPDGFVVKIQTNHATLSEGPSGTSGTRDATFKYSSAETGATYTCRLITPTSTPDFGDCSSGEQKYTGLPDGAYRFEVRSFDRGGTTDGTTTKREFNVNTTPRASFTIAPNPALVGRSVTFDGSPSSASTPIAKYEWDLDGDGSFETNSGGTPTVTQTYPSTGSFDVGLRITDGEGRTGTATNALQVNSATGPGTQFGVTINNGAQFTNDPNVTVTATFPSFTTGLLFSNDGGFGKAQTFPAKKDTSWKLDSSGPERLPKTIYVRFLTGSIASSSFQDDIILDETPPKVDQAVVAPAGPPSGATAAALRMFKVKMKATDKTSGVSTVQVTANKKKPGKALRYKKKFTVKSAKKPKWVRARDRAGNWSKWKKAR